MNDDLIASDRLPIARKSVLPGTGFFVPDSFEADLDDERTSALLADADVAVVADPDADGLACVALVRTVYDDVRRVPDPPAADTESKTDDERVRDAEADESRDSTGDGDASTVVAETTSTDSATLGRALGSDDPIDEVTESPHRVALLPASPHDFETVLERVAEYGQPGLDCYVCDLCPDRYEYVEEELDALLETADRVSWYDHHQWDADVADAIRAAGVDLVIGESERECTADVALRSLDDEFPDRFHDLAAVTRDHDLWIREDPRSDDLADFAYWTDPETYVETVREYGADLPAWATAYLEERRIEKEALIDRAVARAEYRDVGGYTVGVTYGRCSQNEVAEAMREAGADASVIVKPAGSASIRGTDAFDRCHEVAGLVNGGGHPKAAGCKPAIYRDMLDYAHHWTTRGSVARQTILDAFRTVVADESDEDIDSPT